MGGVRSRGGPAGGGGSEGDDGFLGLGVLFNMLIFV